MTISGKTAAEVLRAICARVDDETMDEIIASLKRVEGNQSFRSSVALLERLAAETRGGDIGRPLLALKGSRSRTAEAPVKSKLE